MTTSYGDPILARGGVDTALVASDGAVAEAPVVGPPLGSAVVRNSFLTIAPFVLSDMISLALAGLGAHAVLGWLYPEVAASAASLAVVSLFPLLLGYWLSGIYSEIWIHPAIEFRQLTHVSTMAIIAVMTVGIVAPPLAVWASVAWMSSVVIVPLLRTIARACCVKRKWWGYPTLIICSSDGADNVARLVLDCPRSGLRPVLMTDPHGNFRSDKLRVVNDPAALASQIATHGVRHAVVSLPDYSFNRLSVVLDRYSNLVPHLLVLSDAATLPTLWGASRSGGRLSGIEVRNGLLLATLQSVKRVFDIVASAGALVVGLPLFLGIALLIKVSSRGPVLFGHRRIGRHGRPFTAWKFRTMHLNSDAILRSYLERVASAGVEWERDRKLRNDPRITRMGRLLRRTSLDDRGRAAAPVAGSRRGQRCLPGIGEAGPLLQCVGRSNSFGDGMPGGAGRSAGIGRANRSCRGAAARGAGARCAASVKVMTVPYGH